MSEIRHVRHLLNYSHPAARMNQIAFTSTCVPETENEMVSGFCVRETEVHHINSLAPIEPVNRKKKQRQAKAEAVLLFYFF